MRPHAPQRKRLLPDRYYPSVQEASIPGDAVPSRVPVSLNFWQALTGCKISVMLFLLALTMPTYTSFAAGSMRLTLYRVLLIVTIFPCAVRLFSGQLKLLPADILIVFGSVWAALTLVYHHGAGEGLETGGIFIVESLGAYLLARTAIRSERDFQGFVAVMLLLVFVLLPGTLVEALTNRNLFGQSPSGMDMRLGLHRARGPFDHPIVFGVFVASVFGMGWFYFPRAEKPIGMPRIFRASGILCATIASVSSGALTAVIVQLLLIAWNYLAGGIRKRWRLFLYLLALVYVVIDLLSNRTPMKVFLTYLTFSTHTAYNRLIIWEWGFHHNVLENPLLGIGLNIWTRPPWMHSTSMDNFWLVLMVRHGFPCFLPIAAGGLYILFAGARRAGSVGLGSLQKGWTITMIGLIVAGSTVHFWNALFAYFFFILGAGAWFCRPLSNTTKEAKSN